MLSGEPKKSYAHALRKFIILSGTVFLLFVIFGYFASEYLQVSVLRQFQEVFKDLTKLGPFELTFFIFLNNSAKSFAAIILGIAFGVVPIAFLVLNGLIIGLVIFEVIKSKGVLFTMAAILPHGILEIPLFLVSMAIGLKIGYEALKKIKSEGSVKKEIKIGIKFFIFKILPFFFLAAIIEVFVTPLIVFLIGA
ncbi:MAG: stage II sporulation protein M [Candidatus Bathyarchaeia archaeon]